MRPLTDAEIDVDESGSRLDVAKTWRSISHHHDRISVLLAELRHSVRH